MTSEEIDALWDFNDPAKSYKAFETALAESPASADEIHTQIARSLGLQQKFSDARSELAKISTKPSNVVAVRVALENGRIENSSCNKPAAQPYFLNAYEQAVKHKLDFYAVDADRKSTRLNSSHRH